MLRDGVCIEMRKEEGMHEGTHPMVTTLRNRHLQPAASADPVIATQRKGKVLLQGPLLLSIAVIQ